MATTQILFSGFGGQGILFSGKVFAYDALLKNRQVSWLPSYGPEMRGGTASCGVILSDEQISSPIIAAPDILVAMNLPSYDKFEGTVAPGGKVFVDSSLVDRTAARDDVETFYIPATRIADENGMPTLANMVIIGSILKECDIVAYDDMPKVLEQVISAKRKDMLELNLKAISLGYEYEG